MVAPFQITLEFNSKVWIVIHRLKYMASRSVSTSCPVAGLSWWHWGCSISAHWIAPTKFGTSLGVKWGLSGALSHPGSVSPCHSWFLCTGAAISQKKQVCESGWCSYQCHWCKGGTLVAQAQYLEVHLTILEPVLTSLHLVLLAVNDQLL